MGFFKNWLAKRAAKKDKTLASVIEKNDENRVFKNSENQKKFDDGLRKSSTALENGISQLLKKYQKIDESLFDDLEELLISYDVGFNASQKILEAIREEVSYQNVVDPKLIKDIFVDKMFVYYITNLSVNTEINLFDNKTNVVLVVGVNGVGKTTSIAKITNSFVQQGKKVLLVAGDTFRAGAVEQLKVWAEKLNVDIVYSDKEGQDPASLIYTGVKKGYDEKYDLVICDTSGRLQNKVNLMNELKKIVNVIHKFDETAPHETLLVLDATTGQSGLNQAKAFNEVADISGIILTKMDSTSKGGIIFAIKDIFNTPVKFIGLGETINDLEPFDLQKFIDGMAAEFDESIKK
ncbi:MAG: signal recognition particle-docking protein FtsY [Ureaplasma sp.]|nr:signal recognition particle-docking protein FtsY [Ureaplasma sp.]